MDPDIELQGVDKEVKETVVVKDPEGSRVTKTIKRVNSPNGTVETVESDFSTINTKSANISSHMGEVLRSEKVEQPVIKTEHPQKVYETKKTILRFHQIAWAILVIIEFLLGFRVTLKALGANPASIFVDLIYTLSYPFAVPFAGIFRTDTTLTGSVFEWSTILAGLVYALITYGVMQLVTFTKPITPHDTRFV